MMQKHLDQFFSQHIQNTEVQLQKRLSDRDRGMWLTFRSIFKFPQLVVYHNFDVDRKTAKNSGGDGSYLQYLWLMF